MSFPLVPWITHHVMKEIHAGADNLKAIYNKCKLKKLATKELGEMTEHDGIMEINPENTVLNQVKADRNKMERTFYYRVKQPLQLEASDLAEGFLSGLAVLLLQSPVDSVVPSSDMVVGIF